MRLTEKRDGKNVIPLRQDGSTKWALSSTGMGESSTQFLYGVHADKLANYEDAEEQGLLLRLKAKVGDLVYFPIYDYHDSAIITAIRIEENGVFFDWAQYEVGADCTEVWDEGSFSLEDIGETVFLTREEAEAALAEMRSTETTQMSR